MLRRRTRQLAREAAAAAAAAAANNSSSEDEGISITNVVQAYKSLDDMAARLESQLDAATSVGDVDQEAFELSP